MNTNTLNPLAIAAGLAPAILGHDFSQHSRGEFAEALWQKHGLRYNFRACHVLRYAMKV